MTRHAVAHRICAVALLLLAGSPLTAPFSTYDLADFFGGHDSVAGTFAQAKVGPDDPLPNVSALFQLRPPRGVAIWRVSLLVSPSPGRATLLLPLRL